MADAPDFAEGSDFDQTSHDGSTNVIDDRPRLNHSQGTASLAHGEHVHQQLVNSRAYVATRDQYVTNITRETSNSDFRTPTKLAPNEGELLSNDSYIGKFWKWMTGQYVTSFARKVNAFSWTNIRGRVMDDYDDLPKLDLELYPQMKTDFELFRGDFVPQDGFSAHCQPKKGRFIELKELMKIIRYPQGKPSVIIGQPGSGKTILMKRMAKKLMLENNLDCDQQVGWWEMFFGESRDCDVVLFMNIRDLPDCSDGTLGNVIFNPWLIGLNAEEFQYGLQAIIDNKLKVIIFFDGLDQATWEPQCDMKIGTFQKESTGFIFGNILSGQLLPNVPITVSSREHSVAQLSSRMRPQFVGALVGFTDADAKSLYCQIMGQGSSKDWEAMRKSNPAMHSMCLTPLFLIFYMITKKRNPDDPPDCASGVMVSIIQAFMECDNTTKFPGDRTLLAKLEKMALEGTKEKRVVFDRHDLEMFELVFKEISAIIIQVPGISFLGQRFLDGMFKFFFSHQTLQEILSALFVVDMDYKSFQHIVDVEFEKPHWSMVRSFTCGILNNESVKRRMTLIMPKSSDLTKKNQYLMKHLQRQMGRNQSPASKLDTFVALKEANAFEILRGLTRNIDFTRSQLSLVFISTLCSVLKYVGEVASLSLVDCGMDRSLFQYFAEEANGLGIKIGKLDMQSNDGCKDVKIWEKIFCRFSISQCIMDIQRNEQNEIDINAVKQIVEAAGGKVQNFQFGRQSKFRLSIEQLQELGELKFGMTIHELIIGLDTESFNADVWKQILRETPFTVENCVIEDNSRQTERGRDEGELWITVAKYLKAVKVKKISLMLKEVYWGIRDLRLLGDLNVTGEIQKLIVGLEAESYELEVWRQTFQKMTFTVKRCFIDDTQPTITGGNNGRFWLDVVKSVNVNKVKDVFLTLKEVSLDMYTLMLLASTVTGEIRSLSLSDEFLRKNDWRRLGIAARKFNVANLYHHDSTPPDLRSFAEGHGRLQIKRIAFARGFPRLQLSDMGNIAPLNAERTNFWRVKMNDTRLRFQPEDIGCLIRHSEPDEVILDANFAVLNVSSFASGLDGYRIKTLAVPVTSVNGAKVCELVRKCEVETIYIKQADEAEDFIKTLKEDTNNLEMLPEGQWVERFKN